MSSIDTLFRYIDELSPVYLELLGKLIKIASPTGYEGECQKRVAWAMKELGILHDRVFASNDPPFQPTNRNYDDRPCLVGCLPGSSGNRDFILNAHIDTAPVEDEKSWTHPPYQGVVRGGRIYGRGALDDKAGVALMLLLADGLKRSKTSFPGNIYFESVIEDEDSGNGTLACTQAGYFCEAGIIIDGTWPLRIIDSHLGQIGLQLEVKGIPAPACSSQRGLNPIMITYKVLESIEEYIRAKNREHKCWLNIEQPFFMNPGAIHSGVWSGAIPEVCRCMLQIGFPPPHLPNDILGDLEKILARTAGNYPGASIGLRPGALFTAPFQNRDNPMTRIVKETVEELTGQEVLVQAVSGHCDLRHLKKRDGSLADACLYGPGGGANPHVGDEYYLVDDFGQVAKNIAAALLRFYA